MPYIFEAEVSPGQDRLRGPEAVVTLSRLGGELIRYEVQDPRGGPCHSLLWEGKGRGLWPGRAPVLFPIVGALAGDESRSQEGLIRLPMHGFAQATHFERVDGRAGSQHADVVYRLESSERTKPKYPFEFRLELAYVLDDTGLAISFTILNPGPNVLFFQCGWHPGFAIPGGLGDGWSLRFPEVPARRFFCLQEGVSLLTGECDELSDLSAFTTDMRDLEATILLEIPEPRHRHCRLEHRQSGRGVELSFPDFPHLALWSQEGAEFLCLEPCQGLDDHVQQEPFEAKVGIVRLGPGQQTRREARIRPFFRI